MSASISSRLLAEVSSWSATPFYLLGRSKAGTDCLSQVYCALRDLFLIPQNLELPEIDYANLSLDSLPNNFVRDHLSFLWNSIERYRTQIYLSPEDRHFQAGDLICFSSPGQVGNHAAWAATEGKRPMIWHMVDNSHFCKTPLPSSWIPVAIFRVFGTTEL